MDANIQSKQNIRQVVPFFMITEMERSLQFYVYGLGFEMKNKWTPNGKIAWCWLQREGAAIMLQEYKKEFVQKIQTKLGEGVSIWFVCEDALGLYLSLIHISEPT